MNISRRNVLLGATAAAALGPIAARAQTSEVVIGVIYPFSGASAQMGVDAQKSYETALDIINKNHDFDLPLAKGEGLPGRGVAGVHDQLLRRVDLEDVAHHGQHGTALVHHPDARGSGAGMPHVIVRVEGREPHHAAVAALQQFLCGEISRVRR